MARDPIVRTVFWEMASEVAIRFSRGLNALIRKGGVAAFRAAAQTLRDQRDWIFIQLENIQ